MAEDLVLDQQGEVATLSFNLPQTRNALTLAIWQRLPELLAEVESDPGVKVLVVRGAGRDAFASGADIGEFETLRLDHEKAERYDMAVSRAEGALASLAKPVDRHGPRALHRRGVRARSGRATSASATTAAASTSPRARSGSCTGRPRRSAWST